MPTPVRLHHAVGGMSEDPEWFVRGSDRNSTQRVTEPGTGIARAFMHGLPREHVDRVSTRSSRSTATAVHETSGVNGAIPSSCRDPPNASLSRSGAHAVKADTDELPQSLRHREMNSVHEDVPEVEVCLLEYDRRPLELGAHEVAVDDVLGTLQPGFGEDEEHDITPRGSCVSP